MDQVLDIQDQKYVFIGEQTKIEGTLNFYGDTRIAATVSGQIKMHYNAPLIIEPTGHIIGEIHCDNIIIYGKCEGSIHADGHVTIHPYAEVEGTINAKNLIIKPGAIINIQGSANP